MQKVYKRDFQCSRVYKWERKQGLAWRKEQFTLEQCKAVVGQLSRAYGIKPPTLEPRNRKNTYAFAWRARIVLPRWGWNLCVLLHEFSHSLRANYQHNPSFVRLYMEVLSHNGFGNVAELKRSAKVHKVKVGSRRDIPKPLSGQHLKVRIPPP